MGSKGQYWLHAADDLADSFSVSTSYFIRNGIYTMHFYAGERHQDIALCREDFRQKTIEQLKAEIIAKTAWLSK